MEKAIQSVSRCFSVLRELNRNNGSSLRNISLNIQLPRGTAYRLLETLIGEGYVRKDPHTGGYWLQRKVWELGVGYKDQDWILDGSTAQVIADLYREVRWCLALSTPEQDSMIVRLATERRHPDGVRTIAGLKAPMLKYGTGYAYLAYCKDEERDAILNIIFDETKAHSEKPKDLTVTRRAVLDELDRIRSTGYCLHKADQRSRQLSVPVFHGGSAAGALSMTYFSSTVKPAEIASIFAPRLQKAAAMISLAPT